MFDRLMDKVRQWLEAFREHVGPAFHPRFTRVSPAFHQRCASVSPAFVTRVRPVFGRTMDTSGLWLQQVGPAVLSAYRLGRLCLIGVV